MKTEGHARTICVRVRLCYFLANNKIRLQTGKIRDTVHGEREQERIVSGQGSYIRPSSWYEVRTLVHRIFRTLLYFPPAVLCFILPTPLHGQPAHTCIGTNQKKKKEEKNTK